METVVRGVDGDSTAVDGDIANALPCGARFVIETDSLDALCGDIGLVGVSVHAHTAHAASAAEIEAACVAAGSCTAACEGASLIGLDIEVSAVHNEELLCGDTVSIGINVHCAAVYCNDTHLLCSRGHICGCSLDTVPCLGIYAYTESGVVHLCAVI